MALAALDKQIKAVKVLDTGCAFVAAPSGTLVAFAAKKGWTGKKTAKEIGIPAAVAGGRAPWVEAKDPVSGRDSRGGGRSHRPGRRDGRRGRRGVRSDLRGDVDRQVAEVAAAIEQLAAQAERLDRLVGQFSV